MNDPLSIERIRLARQTLAKAASTPNFPGAIDQPNPQDVFLEAKRNLAALVQQLHGNKAWETMLDED